MITHRINYVGWHGYTGFSLECLARLLEALGESRDLRFWNDREAAAGTDIGEAGSVAKPAGI